MITPPPISELQPGDILLYGECTLLSWLIRFRTWSDVSHVEIYCGQMLGQDFSLASRNEGVNKYPLRTDGLRYVYRPRVGFSFAKAMEWFQRVRGTKYGTLDLFRFYGVNIPTKGLICSQFADLFFQNADLELFNINYPAGAVCPGDFCKVSSELLDEVWRWKPGDEQLPEVLQ